MDRTASPDTSFGDKTAPLPRPVSGAGEDAPERVSPAALIGFVAMVVGMFMAILDIQVVASSLPQIQAGLAASADEIVWIQTSYLVAEVVMIPLSGWLARVFSTRWLYTVSCAGFTLASLGCALAWDMSSMIAFRVIQGFIGGAMIPTAFAANYKLFPPRHQTTGMVVIGLVATLAPALGPTIGGWLTETYSWHWVFLVNLVPGTLVTLIVAATVRIDRAELGLLRRIDFLGILAVAGFLGSLEIVLEEGPREDWFDADYIRWFAALGLASGIALLVRELRTPEPVVDLRAFADRNFTLGCLLSFVLGVFLYGTSYMLPQLLSQVRGFNSLQIGTVMIVWGAFQFLSAPIAGMLDRRVDPRLIMALGFGLCATGLWLNSHMTADVGPRELFWPQAVFGFSVMFMMVPMASVALGRLPVERVGNASGLFNVMRNIGGAVGLALINDRWDDRFDRHYWVLVERLTPDRAPLQDWLDRSGQMLGTLGERIGPPEAASHALLARLVGREATVMAWNDVFWLLSVLVASAVLLLPWLRKPENEGQIIAH